jgi:hypothetical protein
MGGRRAAMSASVLDAVILDAPVLDVPLLDALVGRTGTQNFLEILANRIVELARLRFSIILTAHWESLERGDRLHRKELHGDLEQLHELYLRKLDEIAMAFGVQAAIDAKKKVEREVCVPPEEKVLATRMRELGDDGGDEEAFDI